MTCIVIIQEIIIASYIGIFDLLSAHRFKVKEIIEKKMCLKSFCSFNSFGVLENVDLITFKIIIEMHSFK